MANFGTYEGHRIHADATSKAVDTVTAAFDRAQRQKQFDQQQANWEKEHQYKIDQDKLDQDYRNQQTAITNAQNLTENTGLVHNAYKDEITGQWLVDSTGTDSYDKERDLISDKQTKITQDIERIKSSGKAGTYEDIHGNIVHYDPVAEGLIIDNTQHDLTQKKKKTEKDAAIKDARSIYSTQMMSEDLDLGNLSNLSNMMDRSQIMTMLKESNPNIDWTEDDVNAILADQANWAPEVKNKIRQKYSGMDADSLNLTLTEDDKIAVKNYVRSVMPNQKLPAGFDVGQWLTGNEDFYDWNSEEGKVQKEAQGWTYTKKTGAGEYINPTIIYSQDDNPGWGGHIEFIGNTKDPSSDDRATRNVLLDAIKLMKDQEAEKGLMDASDDFELERSKSGGTWTLREKDIFGDDEYEVKVIDGKAMINWEGDDWIELTGDLDWD